MNKEQRTKNMEPVTVFWFRRDLRLADNRGLYEAQKTGLQVLPLFIFDSDILDKLTPDDRRVEFIHQQITEIDMELRKFGSGLMVKRGVPVEVFKELLLNLNIKTVCTNKDFEPYGIKRDQKVKALLAEREVEFCTFTDHLIMEPGSVVRSDGKPYEVFTAFRNQWLKIFEEQRKSKHPSTHEFESYKELTNSLLKFNPPAIPSLKEIGFNGSDFEFPSKEINIEKITNYDVSRDIPSLDSTSRIGIHLRFGTVSIRNIIKITASSSPVWLNELIWREFFIHILAFYPEVVHQSFKKRYDNIKWLNNEDNFRKWCDGKTGFPLVDAGMRELKETGFMHNRVRMVTASFLVKHLLIDWRWGEAWFASLLLDYELASNNGNWQWAAGCGCDAAPYFRIFNPIRQQQRFDPDFIYIKKWVPEFGTIEYPEPIVDHEYARQRCIKAFKEALDRG